MTENGLGSPLCKLPGQLSAPAAHNCEMSGFIAAPEPTGNYAFDVNIESSQGKLSNDVAAIAQDFAEPAWIALVSVVHALVAMLEWCYSLNLLGGAAIAQVTVALSAAGLAFTQPWLELALAIAAVLAVYHGLVRRRVAETVGQALTLLAMVLLGLWLMASPTGTVGVVERWADESALGALAVMSAGTTSHPHATLARAMGGVFSVAVTAPWCYLEFGNVAWCMDPSRLDPRLSKAALDIARRQPSSASLLRSARTNGQIFLALPANESERNSSRQPGTLLSVLCGGEHPADECRGPTASEAAFRSERGTQGRLMGLGAIWLGALGMLLVLGLLAARLLVAALATLLYLLLAPAAVLMPALGETGRSLFRDWTMRLLAACVSKLTYSFLLGVMLAASGVLLSVSALGWWAQWCLFSAFWWTAFAKRRQALELLSKGRRPVVVRSGGAAWRMVEAVQIGRMLRGMTRAMRRRASSLMAQASDVGVERRR